MADINLKHSKLAVIGAGTMGIGIAQLAAMSGHQTYVFDVDVAKTEQAIAQLSLALEQRVNAGKMTSQVFTRIFSNLQVVSHLEQLADADIIIEAIVENKDVKQQLFHQLAEICSVHTIFASNTSSISITAIASAVPHPERVVGLHFFNPAPVMKLVEVIQGLKTSKAIVDALLCLMHEWNKIPVVAKSTPGFIVNRVARPFYAEALRALQENVTTPEQLDFMVRECGGFAMGPCELTDLIGQDVNLSVTQSVYDAFYYEPKYRPSLVQKALVDAGCYGRKTQQGFYDYSQIQPSPQYVLPKAVLHNKAPLSVDVVGDWSHSSALIQRLAQAASVQLNRVKEHSQLNSCNEIRLGDVKIRFSLGASVELDATHEKVLLIDWHANWAEAKAIAITASELCTVEDICLIEQLFAAIDVVPVWSKDHPGLYVLRTIVMLINEACEAVLHAVSSEQDIDLAMKYGVNYPQGPFEWAEKIGYKFVLETLENLYRIYAEERYRPNIYLRKKAAKGQAHLIQSQLGLRSAG